MNETSYIEANSTWNEFATISDPSPVTERVAALNLLHPMTVGAVTDASFERWRSHLGNSLRSWRDAESVSQRHFWNAYGLLLREYPGWTFDESAYQLIDPNSYVLKDAGSSVATDWITFFDSKAAFVGADLGPTPWDYDLSVRSIRAIFDDLVLNLEHYERAASKAEIIALIRDTFTRGILVRGKRRSVSSNSAICTAPTTHDLVMSFTIHTGNSPPAGAASRSTVGRALSTERAALEVNHEQVRRRKNSPNLRDTVLQRRAQTRVRARARTRTSFDCRVQPAGRWRSRSNSSLAEFA